MIKVTKNSTASDQVIALVREVLAGWPLYQPEHYVAAQPLTVSAEERGEYWIGYWTNRRLREERFVRIGNGFDLEIKGDVAYLLSIELVEDERGKGHGAALYDAICELAKRLGCKTVLQTASGTTQTGEPRLDYLLRHGWEQVTDRTVQRKLS